MYKNRATYPFIYDGKIVGYTGRYVKEIKDKKMPKYHAETPESFLTNLDRQKREDKKFVILTEGVFDAHVVDGVAVLGNNLTADQISIIERLGKEIIVVPDKDKDGQLLFDTAIEHGWTISTPDWGAGVKDPAGAVEKYGRILTVQSIIESRDKNAFAAKLKRKLDKF
jgi:DNA primase